MVMTYKTYITVFASAGVQELCMSELVLTNTTDTAVIPGGYKNTYLAVDKSGEAETRKFPEVIGLKSATQVN